MCTSCPQRTFEGSTASVLSIQFVNAGLQILSSSADGLIRLWSIRSGECENVFDKHQDKVWALATPPESYYNQSLTVSSEGEEEGEGSSSNTKDTHSTRRVFFSGGSDSSLQTWVDVTKEQEMERLKTAENDLITEQEMQNDIRGKRYDKVGTYYDHFIMSTRLYVYFYLCLCLHITTHNYILFKSYKAVFTYC